MNATRRSRRSSSEQKLDRLSSRRVRIENQISTWLSHETFGNEQGRRLWARFTVHYTPKHASWLNQAEIAISVMQRCCLGNERLGSATKLRQRIIPFWNKRRNERWTIEWRFTKKKAKFWIRTFESKH